MRKFFHFTACLMMCRYSLVTPCSRADDSRLLAGSLLMKEEMALQASDYWLDQTLTGSFVLDFSIECSVIC